MNTLSVDNESLHESQRYHAVDGWDEEEQGTDNNSTSNPTMKDIHKLLMDHQEEIRTEFNEIEERLRGIQCCGYITYHLVFFLVVFVFILVHNL